MQKSSLLSLAVAAVLALLAAPLTGRSAVVSLAGDNTNSPAFNRPTETGALSFQNPRFDAYLFTVDLGGAYNFTLVAGNPAFFDTYLHLYQVGFNPADPQANFLRANDDAPGGQNAGSALTGVTLAAGTRYYLVADGFSVLDYGAYTATIQGPGNINAALVPEPSSGALLAALGAALVGWRLRRRARAAGAVASVG